MSVLRKPWRAAYPVCPASLLAAAACLLSAAAGASAPDTATSRPDTTAQPGVSAPRQGATALDRFLDGLTTLRTRFTQTVVDASGKELESGQGTLLVRRPERFRWEYTPRGGDSQLLVADGRNLWFYDRALEQATVKPAANALTATPVMLLSGSAAQLREAFTIVDVGVHGSLDWVQVTPRSATAEFSSAELGFSGTTLRRLVIRDRLNQTNTLEFTDSRRDAPVSDAELRFVPPAGVDVIGNAQAAP